MKTLMLFVLLVLSLPKLAFSTDPPVGSHTEISSVPLTVEDLAELLRFDSYKFKIDNIATGERFKIEIHVYSKPTAEPEVLWSREFQKTEFTCNGPACDPAKATHATFRIDFSSESTGRKHALSSQDSRLNVSVVSNWLRPSGIHGGIKNPLAEYKATEKSTYVASSAEAQLPMKNPDSSVQRLIYMAPNKDFVGRPVGEPKKWDELFPRAEVVLQVVRKNK